jgi:organic hydroperoxide reductase OsmC/OhrA
MKISATLQSSFEQHTIVVKTDDNAKEMHIAPKSSGYGSSLNGGEILMVALATCFCNDIYREAAKRQIEVKSIEVEFHSDFGSEGEPGTNFRYKAQVDSTASPTEIQDLIHHTDQIAEIHNTLRKGVNVTLEG